MCSYKAIDPTVGLPLIVPSPYHNSGSVLLLVHRPEAQSHHQRKPPIFYCPDFPLTWSIRPRVGGNGEPQIPVGHLSTSSSSLHRPPLTIIINTYSFCHRENLWIIKYFAVQLHPVVCPSSYWLIYTRFAQFSTMFVQLIPIIHISMGSSGIVARNLSLANIIILQRNKH